MTAEAVVRLRYLSGEIAEVELDAVGARHLQGISPWRTFRWYRGQRHLPGSYWSDTMRAPIGYESQLELANLILMDFDPGVRFIVSQPFLLEGWDGARMRRHVPDYVVQLSDGRVRVIDVKPSNRLERPKVRESLAWTRRLMSVPSWDYEIVSEPDPTLLANVRFLSGFRWGDRYEADEVEMTRAVIDAATTFDEAVGRAAGVLEKRSRARAVVLHLLWRGRLKTDLTRMLDSDSTVVPT